MNAALKIRVVIGFAGALLAAGHARAQVWTRDPNFAPVLRNDAPALTAATFAPLPDGRVLVFGSFTHLQNGALPAPGLARLAADGTPDPSFRAALADNESVLAAAPLAEGRALALRFANATPATFAFVRLLADGEPDPAFTPISANYTSNLMPLIDGRTLAWSNYLVLNGTDRHRLARFNADGTFDAAFSPALPADVTDLVTVAGQPDGKILVSAWVNTAANAPATGRLFRLAADGRIDASFAAFAAAKPFTTLAAQPDGKILAVAGVTLARFAADGSADANFLPQIPDLHAIERLAVCADGQIVAQAQVGPGAGPWPSTVLFLSPTGGVQRDLRAVLGADRTLWLASIQPDGTLLVVHGLAALGFATPVPIPATGTPIPISVTPIDPALVGTATEPPGTSPVNPGTTTGTMPPNYSQPAVVPARAALARVSADGNTAAPLDPGVIRRSAGYVGGVITDSASRLIVIGTFTHIDGQPRAGLARFTAAGALDATFVPAPGDATLTLILLLAPDGGMIVRATALGDRGTDGLYRTADRIVRLRGDGSVDAAFAPTADYTDSNTHWHAIATDGRVLVSHFSPDNNNEENLRLVWLGGDGRPGVTLPTRFAGLQTVIGVTVGTVATITFTDGSGATAGSPSDPGLYGNPFQFAQPLANGQLLVAGAFLRVNGADRPWLARLNADGSLDASYAPDFSDFSGSVYASSADATGRVFVSGQAWTNGRLTAVRYRLLSDGRRDPSFFSPLYSAPSFPSWTLLQLANGLPDLNFSNRLTQSDGTTVTIHTVITAADGTAWTIGPLARFTASDVAAITVPPVDQTVVTGRDASFLVGLGSRHAAAYQWLFEGAPIPDATLPFLTLSGVQPAQAGHYQVRVTLDGQNLISAAATLTVLGGAARLVNFSALTTVAPGATPIAGFSIGADASPRTWLVRTMGPSLSHFGVSTPVADPELALFRDTAEIAHDRGGAVAAPAAGLAQRVGAFPAYTPNLWWEIMFPEWKSTESALVPSLAAGNYTARVTSTANGSGVALLEVYDSIPTGASGALHNVSLRSRTGPAMNATTVGFVIAGNAPLRVLIRGLGPALAQFGISGAIADPRLALCTGNSSHGPIATNSGWAGNTDVADAARRAGAFALPAGSRDAALVLRLEPGAYTVQLTSASGGTGEAMIEIYVVGI